jgi:hypothetical protein
VAGSHSFYENLRSGVPAPPVDPDDLKRVWEFVRTVRARLSSRQSETGATAGFEPFGIDSDLLVKHCSPGANVAAVMFRCQVMQLLVQQGLLAPWLHGENPDEFLFQVFATYPVHIGEFDTVSLLEHVRRARRG